MVLARSLFLLATSTLASSQEGLSLLQTQTRLLASDAEQKFHQHRSLPDPEHKSAIGRTGRDEFSQYVRYDEIDYDCDLGNGKWIYTSSAWPVTNGNQANHMKLPQPWIPWIQDLSTSVSTISEIQTDADGNRKAVAADPPEVIELGPVQDEKDCYRRARVDQRCNFFVEDLRNLRKKQAQGLLPPGTAPDRQKADGVVMSTTGVYYKPSGVWKDQHNFPTCFCGTWNRGGLMEFEAWPDQDVHWGAWFCALQPEDMDGVTAKTKPDDEPKAAKGPQRPKLSKEEREACKAAKAARKTAKAAQKGLRKQVKDARAALKLLKASLKEAASDTQAKKSAVEEVCR